MSRPLVAVTMGDPAGIGPEVVARLFADADVRDQARSFVIGDRAALERAQAVVGVASPVRQIASAAEARADGPGIDVLQVGELPDDLPIGRVDARAGAASYSYVARAIELGTCEDVAAIVTAPINKEALALAGAPYPDHTEALAALTGAVHYAMMLAAGDFRVVLASTHVSLRDAVTALSIDRELSVIRLVDRELRRLGIPRPRIAVAGVNPHAGEHGLFGDEERRLITPAIELAAGEGIDATGPWPGDTIFRRAYTGEFDVVVAQYHDQGLIPLKMVGFERGVNVTLGLPFVRTSVDHGTAFDIAGSGHASHESLRAALDLACRLAAARTEGGGTS